MTTRIVFTFLTVGLLCSVSALPLISYKEDADKQLYIPYYSYLPEKQDAEEQGYRIEYDNAENQGRRIPFGSATQQSSYYPYYYFSQPAKEEGFRFTYPQNTANKEGFRVTFPQQQSYYPIGWTQKEKMDAKQQRLIYRFPQEQQAAAKQQTYSFQWPYGKKQGFSTTWYPGKESKANEQGISFGYGWPQEQGKRVPYGKKQGFSIDWSPGKESKANKQGISIGYSWPQEQGYRFDYSNEQGFASKAKNLARLLCNATYGNGNVAKVAAYAQMDEDSVKKLVDTVKTFGKNLCNIITGNGDGVQDSDKDMTDQLIELLSDEK